MARSGRPAPHELAYALVVVGWAMAWICIEPEKRKDISSTWLVEPLLLAEGEGEEVAETRLALAAATAAKWFDEKVRAYGTKPGGGPGAEGPIATGEGPSFWGWDERHHRVCPSSSTAAAAAAAASASRGRRLF